MHAACVCACHFIITAVVETSIDNMVVLAETKQPEYVYFVRTQDNKLCKIGRWSGTIAKLKGRCATYYGRDRVQDMLIYRTSDSVKREKELHRFCGKEHVELELFNATCVGKFVKYCSRHCDGLMDQEDATQDSNKLPVLSYFRIHLNSLHLRHANIP